MKVRVAWVSKHPILPIQLQVLKQKLGSDIQIFYYTQPFVDVQELYATLKQADIQYAVVVLPLSMIARLSEFHDITWLYSEMQKVHDNCPGLTCELFNSETDTILPTRSNHGIFYRHLRFSTFKKIKGVQLLLESF
jgi:hypothetical protein